MAHAQKIKESVEKDGLLSVNNPNSQSFMYSNSLFAEFKITLVNASKIALALLFEISLSTICTIYMGHLPNSAVILSGVGMTRSLSLIIGEGIVWAFCSGLWTLVPQAIGANEKQLIAVYAQRAFVFTSVLAIPISIIQYFGEPIICFIYSFHSNPLENICMSSPEIRFVLSSYSHWLVPWIWQMVWLTILQRIGQSLNYNTEFVYVVFIPWIISIPLGYILMFSPFQFGYLSTVFMLNFALFLSNVLAITVLYRKGYGFIFKPLPFKIVCEKQGLWEYYLLSWPGCFQTSLTLFIREGILILCGFIYNPSLAVSAFIVSVTLGIPGILSEGIGNAGGIRIGKYVGYGSIKKSKHVICVQFGIEFIFLCVVTIFYLIFRTEIPYLITNDDNIAHIASYLLYFVVARLWITGVYTNLCSIFTAIGYQKITAWIMVTTNYFIIFPLELIILFVFHWNKSIYKGLFTLFSAYILGYIIGCSIVIILLIFYVDWNHAIDNSKSRINKGKKDYGTMES
eukprot:178020_1